jgi:Spy/CpxP family protein refolding chaperone
MRRPSGRRVATVLALAAAIVCLPAVGVTQEASAPPPQTGAPPPPPPQEPQVDPGQLTAAQVEQEFDNFALGQAQRQLGLAEAQYFRFARAYRELQMVKRRALRERRAMTNELGALVRQPGPVADPTAVAAKIAALDEQLVQTAVAVQRAHVAIDNVLNLRQRARFRQFEQQMEQKKLELLALAQAGGRGRGGAVRLPDFR